MRQCQNVCRGEEEEEARGSARMSRTEHAIRFIPWRLTRTRMCAAGSGGLDEALEKQTCGSATEGLSESRVEDGRLGSTGGSWAGCLKPRRMLLCAFGWSLFLVSMRAGVKGEAVRQPLCYGQAFAARADYCTKQPAIDEGVMEVL